MAETYKIVFRKSAEKQLLKLPKPAGLKIIELIKHLSKNPIPANAQKCQVLKIFTDCVPVYIEWFIALTKGC